MVAPDRRARAYLKTNRRRQKSFWFWHSAPVKWFAYKVVSLDTWLWIKMWGPGV